MVSGSGKAANFPQFAGGGAATLGPWDSRAQSSRRPATGPSPTWSGPARASCSSGSTPDSGRPRRRRTSPAAATASTRRSTGAGVVDRLIDASEGYAAADHQHLLDQGIAISNLVARATARADELTAEELRAGRHRLEDLVERVGPNAVAILGITAYRTAFGEPKAKQGRQHTTLGGSELWVVPNPSGLNAHASLDDLAGAYREVAVAAGVPVGTAL